MPQQFNKICIAAMLAATSVAASAQSSVTIFGTVDAGLTRLTGSKGSVTGVSTSNANISRIGFRGIEDMGGGLKAQPKITQGPAQTDMLPCARMISIRFKGTLSVDSGGPVTTPLAMALRERSAVGIVVGRVQRPVAAVMGTA